MSKVKMNVYSPKDNNIETIGVEKTDVIGATVVWNTINGSDYKIGLGIVRMVNYDESNNTDNDALLTDVSFGIEIGKSKEIIVTKSSLDVILVTGLRPVVYSMV